MNSIDAKIAGLEATPVPGWEKALKSSMVWVVMSVALTLLGWSEPAIRLFEQASRLLGAMKSLAP